MAEDGAPGRGMPFRRRWGLGGADAPSMGDEEPRRFRRRRGFRPRRHPWRAAALALLVLLALGMVWTWLTLPDVSGLADGWPERTAYMERWLERSDAGSVDYRPVPLSRIPESVRRAVLVSEDAGFWGHSGFDPHEISTAIREAWEEKRIPRGASTITQQLARNLYLSPSRDPLRKLKEALITRRLEKELSKSRILELYLNVIEFGPGTYGVETASRRYFGKSVSAVTPREAAQLAATIPSPRRNNPSTRTRSFEWRARLAYARAFGREGEAADTLPPSPEVDAPEPPAGATGGAAGTVPPGTVADTGPVTDITAGIGPTDSGTARADTMPVDEGRADSARPEAADAAPSDPIPTDSTRGRFDRAPPSGARAGRGAALDPRRRPATSAPRHAAPGRAGAARRVTRAASWSCGVGDPVENHDTHLAEGRR